jgi:hypothetical protein
VGNSIGESLGKQTMKQEEGAADIVPCKIDDLQYLMMTQNRTSQFKIW